MRIAPQHQRVRLGRVARVAAGVDRRARHLGRLAGAVLLDVEELAFHVELLRDADPVEEIPTARVVLEIVRIGLALLQTEAQAVADEGVVADPGQHQHQRHQRQRLAAVVPAGSWPVVSPGSRQYGGVGIGPDGTLCVKASTQGTEDNATGNTQTILSCGKYVAGNWSWDAMKTVSIGKRHAYDYLFPGAFSPGQLVGVSQSDLYKDVAGYPNSNALYIFNGYGLYTANPGNLIPNDLQAPYPLTPQGNIKIAIGVPQARLYDTFITSNKRLLSTYRGVPGDDNFAKAPELGFYLVAATADGTVLQRKRWAELPTYGNIRIFEDSKQRLWLLWTGQGPSQSNMRIYPLLEQIGSATPYTLGTYVDLSDVFKAGPTWYSIMGAPFLALPRGGQAITRPALEDGDIVEASIAACDTTYDELKASNASNGTNFSIADKCYTRGENKQKILSFRMHLPGG